MTLKDDLTNIANAIRNQYGTTDKYHLADMPELINYLEIRNFLAGNSFEATFQNQWISQDLTGPDVDMWNEYITGKTITFSADAEWAGYKSGSAGDRFFYEFDITTTDDQRHWYGLYFTPTSENDNQHLTSKVTVSDVPVKSINSIKFWDELNTGSHLKVINIKMTINPMEEGSYTQPQQASSASEATSSASSQATQPTQPAASSSNDGTEIE